MTLPHIDSRSVEVRLNDHDGSDQITVRRGWLPMAVWDGVRVRVTSSRGLTVMERFTIECLLELGECGADDLLEVASLPPELCRWLMSSLVQRQIARDIGGGRFVPVHETCETTLAQGSIPVDSEEERTFLWFPETEEFVCLDDPRSIVLQLRNIEPVGRFPFPERWKCEKQSILLMEALQENRIYGHDVPAIQHVLDDAIVKEESSPAYQCRAVLRPESDRQWQLLLQGHRRKRRRQGNPQGGSSDEDVETAEVMMNLPALPRVLDQWLKLFDSHMQKTRDWCDGNGLAGLSQKTDIWEAAIDGDSSRQRAAQGLLSDRLSMLVGINHEIDFSVPLKLKPSDASAKELFAFDDSVRQLLATENVTVMLDTICDARKITRDAILSRLWQLRLFTKVYELREQEDFAE